MVATSNPQNKRRRKNPESSSSNPQHQHHHQINPLSDARRILVRKVTKVVGNEDTGTGTTPTDCDDDGKDGLASKCDTKGVSKKKSGNSKTRLNTTIAKREERKARELWHKKSGAGFALFVEYYGGQPPGVVNSISKVHDENPANGNHTMATEEEEERRKSVTSTEQRRGQSRASKKRRRKKINGNKPICEDNTTKEKSSSDVEENISLINSSYSLTLTKELSPGLLQALKDKPNCEHIIPFLATMSRPLPLTFRIRHTIGLEPKKSIVHEFLKHHSKLVQPVDYDSTNKEAIYQSLPKTNLTKFTLGKISCTLKSTLIDASSNGSIARQELGSMLPVIALSRGKYMKCGSKVLDLCASPGSKTLQALEIVTSSHSLEPPNNTAAASEKRQKAEGRIVANDIHPLRLESLKKAVGRSGMPLSLTNRIRFTNHDAATFPAPKSGSKFDCILADVPCSGDGTIRKDTHILPTWMPSIGNALHDLQLKILKRALKLVKVGGVVAYSTCSLSPVEDEAVVAAALCWANQDNGASMVAVELLEWPSCAMPEFKRAPGVKDWRVADYNDDDIDDDDGDKTETETVGSKILGENSDMECPPNLQWFDTYEDAVKKEMKHASPSMWPPISEKIPTNTNFLHLNRCTRLLPQDNDTGSFFLALLKKNKDI